LAVLAGFIGTIALDPPYRPWVVGFFASMLLFVIITWVKAYFQIIAQARAGLKLMENPKVEILIDETIVEYVSSTGTRYHQWNRVEYFIEGKNFVILMSGSLPLLSLPKAYLSPECLAFLRGKLPNKPPRPRAGKLVMSIAVSLGIVLLLLLGLLGYLWILVTAVRSLWSSSIVSCLKTGD
jgi:hypothetical protein